MSKSSVPNPKSQVFNWPIIGHQKIQKFLQNSILQDRLSHAYLFYGPAEVGKTTVAEKFIASIECYDYNQKSGSQKIYKNFLGDKKIKTQGIPCGECLSCKQIRKGIHPDIYSLEKEKEKKNISIEEIRNLRTKLRSHTFFRTYKIALINQVETLSIGAANALLKTLEEPTEKTILILIAQNLTFIPKTIISRCELIKFLPVALKEIEDFLSLKLGSQSSKLKQIAYLSYGRSGRAIKFFEDKNLWQLYKDQVKNFIEMSRSSPGSKINLIDQLLPKKIKLEKAKEIILPVLNLWTVITHDLILLKIRSSGNIINIWAQKNLENLAKDYSLEKLIKFLKNIEKTKIYLSQNVNPKLALENLVLSL